MATMLVGYDLTGPAQRYVALFAKLKSFGTWWHGLDSTWLVKTELTATELRDALKGFIDAKDALLVLDVSNDAAAWVGLPEPAGDWLSANV